MIKKIIFIILLLPSVLRSESISSYLIKHGISDNKNIVFTCIYGTDCSNCYLGYRTVKKFLKTNNQFKQIILLKNVSKDDANYFLAKTFDIDTLNTLIINDDAFYSIINPDLISSIVILEDTNIVSHIRMKNIDLQTFNNFKTKKLPVETVNMKSISSINAYTFMPLSDSNILLQNSLRNTLTKINIYTKKKYQVFPKNGNEDIQLYEKLLQATSLTKAQKDYNLKYLKESPEESKSDGKNLYTICDVFQSSSKDILICIKLKNVYLEKVNNDTEIFIGSHSIYLKLDENLNINKIIDVPNTVSKNSSFYLWPESYTYDGYTGDFVISCNDYNKKDSNIACYHLSNNALTLNQHYPASIPKYFPIKTPNGIPFSYPLYPFKIKENWYYYFYRDPIIYDLNTQTPYLLSGIKYVKNDTALKKASSIVDVYYFNKSVYVLNMESKLLYLNTYSDNLVLKERFEIGTMIAFNIAFFNNQLWVLKGFETEDPVLEKYTLEDK